MSRSSELRRWCAAVVMGVLVVGALIQTLPLLVWTVAIVPELRREPEAGRLSVSRLTDFPKPPIDWALLRLGALTLRAPVGQGQDPACGRCWDHCLLELEVGTLGILPEWAPASYREALDAFAPDQRDLSPFRSVRANWDTIESLAARVRTRSRLPRSFRFESIESKGLVTVHRASVGQAFVIYPYSLHDEPHRVLGLAGLGPDDVHRVLGSIEIEASGSSSSVSRSTCSSTPHRS